MKPPLNRDDDKTESVVNNSRRYRTGFLKASFIPFTNPTDAERRAMFRLGRRENILHTGSALYHYTSVAGFQGIIQSKGFWASDARFLNDAEEMRHGIDLTARIIAHLARRAKHPGFAEVLDQVRLRITEPVAQWPLIACFSTAQDSLEQWRGYGGAGGICIGLGEPFAPKSNENALQRAPMFYGPRMLPHRVIYSARQKCVLVMSVANRFENEYLTDRREMHDFWPDEHDSHYVDALSKSLRFSLVSFKNPAFTQEAEARVVIYPDQAGEFGGLQFRPSQLGLIPYVSTGQNLRAPVTIREVMVGPSPHQELVAASVRTFLDHHGYQDIGVDLSIIPFRNS